MTAELQRLLALERYRNLAVMEAAMRAEHDKARRERDKTMTREQRFWLQHEASAKLTEGYKALRIAEAKFREAGYQVTADKVALMCIPFEKADASALGAHAHANKGWTHGQPSADEPT